MARSIFSSLIKAGTSSRTALRAGRPITSPKIKIRMIHDFDLNLKCNPNYLKFLGDESETGKRLSHTKTPSMRKVEVETTFFAFLASWRDNSFESRLYFA